MLTNNVTDQNLSSSKGPLKTPMRSSMASASIVVILILVATSLLFYRYLSSRDSLPARLSLAMNQDLNILIKANAVPKNFAKIRGFQISTEGSTFKPWADEIKLRIPTQKNGSHGLDVFIFFFIDDKKLGANVQYNLVEIKSNNTEWETTRSYDLGYIF